MKNQYDDKASLEFEGDNAIIRWDRSRMVTIAKVLGREDRKGRRRYFLDRLVHRPGSSKIGHMKASGAISTVLSEDLAPSEIH